MSYGYDGAGNRVSQQDTAAGNTTSYGYDQADRLTSANISTTVGITQASYLYDGDGLRQSKTITTTGGVTTTAEVWDMSDALPLLVQDGTTKHLSGPDGLSLEQIDGSGHVAYDLHDQLGSTRLLLDSAGATQATYTYDAYGNLTAQTRTGTGSGAAATPFGFAGQYTDAETGWQYLQARYYDPQTGQFTGVDPLESVTQQPYAYTSDDPLNATDPSGLYRCYPFAPDPCDAVAQSIQGGLHQLGDGVGATMDGIRSHIYRFAVGEAGFFDGWSYGGFSQLADLLGAHVDTCSPEYLQGRYGNQPVGIGGIQRRQLMGKTPGKYSATGRAVQARMRSQGLIRGEGADAEVYYAPTKEWYPIAQTDMGHIQDAVNWWNATGKYSGARSPTVRKWMLDPNNYQLEPKSINSSRGGSLTETYDPPAVREGEPIIGE